MKVRIFYCCNHDDFIIDYYNNNSFLHKSQRCIDTSNPYLKIIILNL